MLGRGGSWVGNTVAALSINRFWLYQDFTAGSASPLTITGNDNGAGGTFTFNTANIINGSAVATKTSGNPIYSNTAELSSQLVTTSNTGAAVTLSATPAAGEGTIRVWYLYAMSMASAPVNMEVAPLFVLNTLSQYMDGRYLEISNNLSDIGNQATARTNLGLGTVATKAATVGASILKGDGAGGFANATGDTDYQNPISVAAFSSTPSAKGLTFAADALNLDPADGTHPGGVSIAAQTFAGAKTFSSAPVFSTMTQGSVLFAGASGALIQDNAKFFWDDTNFRLIIGAASGSTAALETRPNADATGGNISFFSADGSKQFSMGVTNAGVYRWVNQMSGSHTLLAITGSQDALVWGQAGKAAFMAIKPAASTPTGSPTMTLEQAGSQTGAALDIWDNAGTPVKQASITHAGAAKFTSTEITGGGVLKLDGSSSGNVTLNAAGTTTSYALVMPSAQGAANTTVLNDGSGNLSWVSASPGFKSNGNVALASGSTSKAIAFGSTFGSTSYVISAQMINTVDASPIHVPMLVIAKSATGFTLEWSDALPTANYTLDWTIEGINNA